MGAGREWNGRCQNISLQKLLPSSGEWSTESEDVGDEIINQFIDGSPFKSFVNLIAAESSVKKHHPTMTVVSCLPLCPTYST